MFVSVTVFVIVTVPSAVVSQVIPVPAAKNKSSPCVIVVALESVVADTVNPLPIVLVSDTVLVKVILSPDLAILKPVPASKTTSSVAAPSAPPCVNLIFSSSELSPSTQDIA